MWVQLPELDLKYWSPTALSKLASLLRTPIMADKNTQEKNKVQFARILIEMEIKEHVPERIYFENEHKVLMQQDVVYEWKPVVCGKCKGYGHETDHCKKGTH